jgi:hypothetical protein
VTVSGTDVPALPMVDVVTRVALMGPVEVRKAA